MTDDHNSPFAPPLRRHLLGEMFAVKDMIGVPGAILGARRRDGADRLRVMVLPGLGANDASTAPLRLYLSRHGFTCEGWGLGFNTGGRGLINSLHELSDRWDVDRDRPHSGEGEVPALIDVVHDRVKERARETGHRYALVGWSLGGFVAREVARDLPDEVAAVVTMGSPALGGPKYTSLAPLFRARKIDIDWIDEETRKRFTRPITQPITSIYSKSDGIVGWTAAVDTQSPNARNVEVNSSHFGIGLNKEAWQIALAALESAAMAEASRAG